MLGLLAFPFILNSCEKDNGTTDYDDVDDDDWRKKAAIAVDYNENEDSTIVYSEF